MDAAGLMLVAIEGGGTKTRGWLLKGDEVVAQRVAGPSNVQALRVVRVAEMILETVDALVGEVSATRTDVEALGLGLAGAGTSADRERVRLALEEAGARMPVAIESDARMVLEGATKGAGGLVLIAGTGSIAIAEQAGLEARSGGWGSALGDEGSGYALGRALLSAVTRELDGRAEGTLALALAQHLRTEVLVGVREWIREHVRDTAAVAAIAVLVLRLAEDGHAVARVTAQQQAGELAAMAVAVWTQAGLPEDAAVVLHGGCLVDSAYYRALVSAGIRARKPAARIAIADPDDALRGCVEMARRALRAKEAR